MLSEEEVAPALKKSYILFKNYDEEDNPEDECILKRSTKHNKAQFSIRQTIQCKMQIRKFKSFKKDVP